MIFVLINNLGFIKDSCLWKTTYVHRPAFLNTRQMLENSYCVCFCYEIFYLRACLHFIRKEDWLVKCLCEPVCVCVSV